MPAPSRSSPARMTCSAASSPCPAATDCAAAAASLVTSAAASDASAAASSRLSCPFFTPACQGPPRREPLTAGGRRRSPRSPARSASKPPSAGGNIGGRRRAGLHAQDFDLYSWRSACCPRNVAVAQHTTRSPPPGIPDLGLSRNDAKGSGERCTLACIDSKKRRYACDEIKLPVKEFDSDRTARDGHTRTARCATPQPEQ